MRTAVGSWSLRAVVMTALAVGTVAGAADPLPRTQPQDVGLSSAKLDEATALLDRFVKEQKIAGAVAGVARHGKLAYLHAAGSQDLAARAPMTDRSLFRIYSMTKSVTATAVMMLFEEGRFSLSDPVSKYLPEFAAVRVAEADGATRPPARPVTVEDLLLHTSGLNHRTSSEYRAAGVRSRTMTLPQFVGNITRAPLMEDPGTRYRYSESSTVLGRLVEIWSGRPFDVFLNERIFKPLAMTDTMFWADADRRSRLTTVYSPGPGGALRPIEIEDVPFSERPALLEGAVGLLSTVPDFVRYSQMLLNRGQLDGARLLKPETVDRIVANGLPEPILKARGGGMGWGIANVNVVIDSTGLPYPANAGEYGWDGSAGTIFWIDPGKKLITVLMAQSSPADPDGLRRQFKTLVQESLVN